MNFAPRSLAAQKCHEGDPMADHAGLQPYSTITSAFSAMSRRSFAWPRFAFSVSPSMAGPRRAVP